MLLPKTIKTYLQNRFSRKADGFGDCIRPAVFLPGYISRLGIILILLLGCLTGRTQGITLVNPSFENQLFAGGSWSYLTSDGLLGGWQWSAASTNAGIISAGGISGQWTSWVNVPPNGTSAAFLQNNATMSQTFTVLVPKSYPINFSASHRRFGWPTDNLTVKVDGITIGYWSGNNFTDDNFISCSAVATNLSIGTHTLSFIGTPNGGDSSIAIDCVTVGAFSVIDAMTLQSDGSLLGTQVAVNNAKSGSRVLIPAGTYVWKGTLTIANDIQLLGAGVDQTVIVDGGANATTLISWTTSSNYFDRLSGFTFKGTTNSALEYYSSVSISGTCHAFRVDNCKFDTLQTAYNLSFSGWVYGVVDHCTWNISGGGAMQLGHDRYGGYYYGDGSWADPDYWGTTNAIYIESCTFANYVDPSPGAHGALDSENGARFVFRNNKLTNCLVGSHGSESGGRLRSIRTCEMYNNNFFWATNNYFNMVPFGFYLRGGTATVWSNTFVGGIQYGVLMANYREYPNPFSTWKNISGVNPWDLNNPTQFASGKATGVTNAWPMASVKDQNQTWTPGQFNGYFLYNTNAGVGFVIISNDVNTLYFSEYNPYAGGDKLVHWSVGDSYKINQVYSTVDQCGRGQGNLLSGDSPTPAWPNQAADPVYIWGNSLTMLIPNNVNNARGNSQSMTIQRGRDWIDDVPRPGYVPLVFPHPLVTGSNTVATVSPPTMTPPTGVKVNPIK